RDASCRHRIRELVAELHHGLRGERRATRRRRVRLRQKRELRSRSGVDDRREREWATARAREHRGHRRRARQRRQLPARPARASVVALTLEFGGIEPLVVAIVPPNTVKVTATPATGLFAPSCTSTAGRFAPETCVPTVALNDAGELAAIDAAAPEPMVTPTVADVRFGALNVSVSGPTGPLAPRFVNVATPLAFVVAVVVPTSV